MANDAAIGFYLRTTVSNGSGAAYRRLGLHADKRSNVCIEPPSCATPRCSRPGATRRDGRVRPRRSALARERQAVAHRQQGVVDPLIIDRAMAAAAQADLLLAVGSTLQVYPVAGVVPVFRWPSRPAHAS